VASGLADQLAIFNRAIRSRNINNSGPTCTDPEAYKLFDLNCGGWAEYIVGSERFPLAITNLYFTGMGSFAF
jgi:hypothetical protein